jgi:small subunit ribosomal protein S11
MAKRKVTKKRVVKKNIGSGIVYVAASFNNTVITMTDMMGNVIAWSSAGALGFRGSKKSIQLEAFGEQAAAAEDWAAGGEWGQAAAEEQQQQQQV